MKRFILLFFVLLEFFCIYAENTMVIPFKMNDNGNIYIEIFDKNFKYIFMFDTGSTCNVLFKSGYEKVKQGFDFNIEEKLLEQVKDKNPVILDSVARDYVKSYIEVNGLTIECAHFFNEKIRFAAKEFIYRPQVYKDFDGSQFDGIIGIDFFSDLDNVTINYITKNIIINNNEKINNSIRMEKLEHTKLYKIEVLINGIEQDAIIDTGSMLFFIRPEYKKTKTYTEQELLDTSDINNPVYKIEESQIEVSLRIGKYSENVIGYFFDEEKVRSTEAGKSFVKKINIIGNQIFQNHVIQLDFEKMEFRIE